MFRAGTAFGLLGLLSGCFLDSVGVGEEQPTGGATSSSGASGGGGAGVDGTGVGGTGVGGVNDGGGPSTGPGGSGGDGGEGGGPGPVDPWWNLGFGHRVKITFDKQSSAEALVDFPVMIRLDPQRFEYAAALAGGDDVRFVDDDGATELAYEIERWTEDGESWLWLRVPQIDAGSTTNHVYLYYDAPAVPAAASPAQVWGSTHLGVYHLANDPAGNLEPDSSNANNDGVPMGSMNAADLVVGVIGAGLELDGVNDYIALGGDHVPALEIEPGEASTIEAWMRSSTPNRQLLTDEASCAGWGIDLDTSGALVGRLFLNGDPSCPADDVYILPSPSSAYDDNMWHHVALVIDRPGGVMRLHVDGALVDTYGSPIDNAIAGGGYYDRIGTNFNNTRAFAGRIDEVRIASVARSTAWIAAQHASMTDAFATFGETETPP